MQKVYINKETKKVVGICEETMNITLDNEFIDLSDEQILILRNRQPDDNYFIIDGEIVKVEDPLKTLTVRINELKRNLADTDYKILKYIEHKLSEEEYTDISTQRQQWRDEINELEEQLNSIIIKE